MAAKKKTRKMDLFPSESTQNFTDEKILEKIFVKSDKRVMKSIKLKNHLYDDVDVYFKPNLKFVVGSLKKQKIVNSDFNILK